MSSWSTTIASSLSFSFFSSAAVGSSGARKAICLPSGDHSNEPTLRLPSVMAYASPPLDGINRSAGIRRDWRGTRGICRLATIAASRRIFLRRCTGATWRVATSNNPDVVRIFRVLRRLSDGEGKALAVRREAQIGDALQVQRLLGVNRWTAGESSVCAAAARTRGLANEGLQIGAARKSGFSWLAPR